MELKSAVAEKRDAFKPRDIPALNGLLEAHCGKSAGNLVPNGMVALELSAIEQDTYELMTKKLAYDCQVF